MRIEKDLIQKRIPYEKKEKWVNNDHSVAIAANKECKTQTKNPPVSNGKIACHEQTWETSSCKFDRGRGTHMHQQLETVEDQADGERASTQLLNQLLASAEMEDGWSPVRPKCWWRKERENSKFQSRNHQPSNTSSNKIPLQETPTWTEEIEILASYERVQLQLPLYRAHGCVLLK